MTHRRVERARLALKPEEANLRWPAIAISWAAPISTPGACGADLEDESSAPLRLRRVRANASRCRVGHPPLVLKRSSLSLRAGGANHQMRLRKKLIAVKKTEIDKKNRPAVTRGS